MHTAIIEDALAYAKDGNEELEEDAGAYGIARPTGRSKAQQRHFVVHTILGFLVQN